MRRAPDLSGTALDDRYELHALIGEGTFGRVYRGRDRRLARDVAVKVIKPWWNEDPEWTRSFEREAQLLASINAPGIVQIFDVGSAPEGLYYVAELVDGESLADRLRAGPLPPLKACEITERLARALAPAHRKGVVHRDVKPANVLIDRDGDIKVGDFGVARLAEGTSDLDAGTVAGTPQYMAPEQARGRATSPATDVYGIAVILYEMLAGHLPFSGRTAVELALCHVHDAPPPLPVETPRALVKIVERALAKEPRERYANARELATALASARASLVDTPTRPWALASAPPLGSPGAARVPRTRAKPPMSARRNFHPSERRQRVALFAAVILLGFGMVVGAMALARGELRVPDLHGMTRARILTTARRVGFHAAFTPSYSPLPAGSAIGQRPAAGSRVADGTTVAVLLSAGPPPVPVPNLVGASLGDAETVLGALKLQPDVARVPAPGVTPGTVTFDPDAGKSLTPGSAVPLSVAEVPQLRYLTGFGGEGGGQSGPFQIRGRRWRIVDDMSYQGICTFIFFCSGPTAKVTNADTGATVDSFDLGEGNGQTQVVRSGPGTYEVQVFPGSDSARWSVTIDDYY